MSSRQLRKLQQQRELEQAKLREQETVGGEDSDEEEPAYKPHFNRPSLFANFAALDDGNEDDADVADEIEEQEPEDEDELPDNEERPPTNATKKPKKPKKKKKKAKQANQRAAALDSIPTQPSEGPDEIDAAFKELKLKSRKGYDTSDILIGPEDVAYENVCALLSINSQHLKVANEMRNLFGRTALDNHDDAGGQVPRGARRRQRAAQQQVDLETALKGHHPPGKGLPELTMRRNIFIQGKDEWPRGTTGGLTMEVVNDEYDNGIVQFRFVHDQTYEKVQQQFNLFVEMGDPQNLIGLLQRNPYNISLLLQVSKIAKDQTDHALSSDLIERALFTFGRAAQSVFATKLSQGKARLDFKRPENRELWLAGYQYIKSLVMKGTYQTALEWAKLLLSLDPGNDPYCMLLMIHHFALRAFEPEYLLKLKDGFDFKDTVKWKICNPPSHIAPSWALAAMQQKDGKKSRSLLKDAIQQLPWLFCKLFQELNLDPPPSIWGVVPRTDAENLFSEIYIRQTKDLWNTPEATSLLVEVAHATEKLHDRELPRLENSQITLDVARFVYLDNTPALMALVPSTLLHRIPNSDSDPLPPYDNIFSWESQENLFNRRDTRRDAEALLGNHFDPIAAIRALIPWAGEQVTDTDIREFLDVNIDREHLNIPNSDEEGEIEGEEGEAAGEGEDDTVPQPRRSGVWRLYDYFFGGGNQAASREAPGNSESEGMDDEAHQQ